MRWEETDSFYTLGARLQYYRGLRRWPYSSAPSYITRLAPFPAKGNARCAASLDVNQEYSRRPLYQRLLKSLNRFRHNVDIDPHKTTHGVSEFAAAKLPALQTLRQCAAINSQSRARLAIRLVEISSFVENAPLTIEVIHFASVTYVWRSPCISRLQERRFSNSATDDELPKRHNEWPCIFQSVILAHSPGLARSMPTAFLSGSMILCRYLATALKGMADHVED
jgi:hypothetical protein